MLPRDDDGYVMDPVEELDEALESNVAGLNDPDREARIAAALAM